MTIEVQLSTLYRTSHYVLPSRATRFSRRAQEISDAIGPVTEQLALAGNHPVSGDLADLSVELFVHLRSVMRTLNDSAVAIDAIADDLVAVDDAAAAWFASQDHYGEDPDLAPEPTTPEV